MADTVCELDCNYVDWDNVVGPLVDPTDPTQGRNYALGHVSDLLNIAREQLSKAKGAGQLTNAEMGEAYAAIIPAAFRESINYELAEALAEMNVQSTGADIELKREQLAADRNKSEAELEKHWGYDVTRDPITGELILGANEADGKIDQEIIAIQKDIEATEAKIELSAAELDLKEAQTSISTAQAQAELYKQWGYDATVVDGKLVLGVKLDTGKIDLENELLDTQEEGEQYKVDAILPLEKEKLEEGIDLLQSQDLEVLASTTRADLESTANISLVDEKADSEEMQNKVGGVIAGQIEKLGNENRILGNKT